MSRRAAIALPLALAAIAVAAALASGGSPERPPASKGVLSTKGTQIVDRAGRPVRLRGFNVLALWPGLPGRTWPMAEYRRIRRGGFNTVRLTAYWDLLEPERGRLDRGYLRSLDRAIARADAAGLYVVLTSIGLYMSDQHVPGWARTGHGLASVERNGAGFVRRLAARYAHRRAVVAHDPVNEPPTYPPDQNRILRMYRVLFDAIRPVAPNTLLMFEPSYGDSSMAGADLGLLGSRRNVVFSMHDYYASGPGNGYAPSGERADRDALVAGLGDGRDPVPDPAAMEAHLQVNLGIMREAGIPTWIGEFGVDLSKPSAERFIREKVALFDRHGLGHAWWLYNHTSNTAPVDQRTKSFRPFVRILLGAG